MGFTKLRLHPKSWVSLSILLVAGLLLSSCEKNEGMGGTGSITGTIVEQFYSKDYSETFHNSPAVDEEVFILFGDDNTPGENVNTGVSGEFRFDYLYPGSYVIYYETEDSVSALDKVWLTIEIELEQDQELDLGELEKMTALDYDDGSAVISGVVEKTKYDNDSKWPNLVLKYIDFAHEHEVYLVYADDEFYSERVRTQYDGYFEFSELIPGKYLVFLYSEDVTKATEHVVITREVSITDFDQVIDLGTIGIEEI